MATAPFLDSLCNVTMAKLIQAKKLPSSPPSPPPPALTPHVHKTLSVFQLVYCCHGSMLTHTVLSLFC